MKKIVILLVCLLAASSLFAADVTLGGAIGLSHSWMSGSDWEADTKYIADEIGFTNTPSTGFRLGFEIGGFANIAINELFSLQPELNFLYMRTGDDVSESLFFTTIDGELTATLKILEIPVLAKFNFKAGSGKFSLFFGPALQFILGDFEVEIKMSGGSYSESASQTGKVDNSVIFAGVVGAGYAMPLGPGSLSFDLRYRRQFTFFFDDDNSRSNTIGLRVGYGIGIKLKGDSCHLLICGKPKDDLRMIPQSEARGPSEQAGCRLVRNCCNNVTVEGIYVLPSTILNVVPLSFSETAETSQPWL